MIITSWGKDVVSLDKLKEIIHFSFFERHGLVKNKTLYLDMASVNTHCLYAPSLNIKHYSRGKGGEREAKIKEKNRVRKKQTLLSLLAGHFKTSPPPLLGGEFDPCLGGVGNLNQKC